MGKVLSRDLITMPTEVWISCMPMKNLNTRHKSLVPTTADIEPRLVYIYSFLMTSRISIALIRYVHLSGFQTPNPKASILFPLRSIGPIELPTVYE
jgi:hypothetical protein